MKWRRDPAIYPAIYHSGDGRFRITWTYTRKWLRMTYSNIQLVDRTTGEGVEGFRSLRDAKESAELIARGARVDSLRGELNVV